MRKYEVQNIKVRARTYKHRVMAIVFLFFLLVGGGGGSRGRRLSGVQVNSEQVGLESLAEAGDRQQRGRSTISGAKTEKSCDLAVRPFLALRDGGYWPAGRGSCADGSSRGVGV